MCGVDLLASFAQIEPIVYIGPTHQISYKMFWSGAEIYRQNKIRHEPFGGEILPPVPILANVILREPSYVYLYHIAKQTHG